MSRLQHEPYQPLPLTNPEFTIHEWPEFCEYRVQNWHLARNGSGKVVEGYSRFSWIEALLSAVVAIIWPSVCDSPKAIIALTILSVYVVWCKCTQVLWESVIAIPPYGIQLETHKGYPSLPLYAIRRFIPTVVLQDFIINEGLRRWNVRYYLAAIKQLKNGTFGVEVAYNNILPHFPVLIEVYRGVHQTLFLPEHTPMDDCK